MDECEVAGTDTAGEVFDLEETDIDNRVAAIMHLQRMQQKQEQTELLESHPVTNADAEFRRGLEELVQDHLNTCMALASCSSSHEMPGPDSSSSSFTSLQGDGSRHRDCDIDTAEHLEDLQNGGIVSSGSGYLQTSFQTPQAGQLQELEELDGVVNELERGSSSEHSQEHDLSGGDARITSPSDSPGRRQSRIMRMWDSRAEEMITTLERQAREAELLALAGRHTVSMLDASFLQEAPTPRSESALERPHRRASSLVQMWRGIEGERGIARDRVPAEGTSTAALNVPTQPPLESREGAGSSPERVPLSIPSNNSEGIEFQGHGLVDNTVESRRGWSGGNEPQLRSATNGSLREGVIGDIDRERVRQIVQQWARQNAVNDIEAGATETHDDMNPWLGHNERERVRHLVRAWVQSSSQRAGGLQRPEVETAVGDTGSQNNGETRFPHMQDLGRQRHDTSQMVLEVLMRVERERQRELERLTELRTVSDFSQRNRLQYLLRGRFLRGGPGDDDHRIPSSASREIGQLQQRHAVSGLREAFRFRLETIVRGQADARSSEAVPRAQPTRDWRHQPEAANAAQRPAQVSEGSLQAVAPSSRDEPESSEYLERPAPAQTDESESTENDMELRELLGRRSVTTILASDFRNRLDHLIRSLVHRQINSPRARPLGPQQPLVRAQLTPLTIPSPPPPPPPPQPAWQNSPWARRTQPRSRVLEWEAGHNSLREDVARLHQSMTEMRRMMESCMDMQYELQRSVRQEVAGALQRMYAGKAAIPEEAVDGSRWTSVEKGICCICCDKQINSLLYRCGHMCTCLDCANEMVYNSGTCPMCRAPIVEVLRAFTIA